MGDRDVRVRILSEYYDEGSKAAERATRRLAAVQMAATREDVAREAQRAAAIVEANRQQAAAMTATGRVILGVSAAIAVGLGLATKSAMDWQSAWAGVTKTVDGSPEQMDQLEASLRGLAKTLPATHEEIAGVAEAAGQLGVKRQDVADFTRTMINMGETTNLSADEAATSIAQLSNIMGIGADKADEMGSAIVALGNNGASTEADIVAMSLRIAGAGRTVGMSTPQVLSYASALSSVGIEAEAGGTAISRVMLQIDKDVASGSDNMAKYARVAGISAEEFAKKWKTDASGALALFIQGLGRMQEQGQNTTATLDDLGFTEVRTADALRRAALAGDLLNETLKVGSIAWIENNALAAEAAKRYETAESKLQMARNQINDAAIDIGGNFLPALAGAAEMVGSLAEGFGALTPTQQGWVATLGATALGLTGIVGGAAVVIPKLRELQVTVDALKGGSSMLGKALGGTASILAGPWGLALAAATIGFGVWLTAQGKAKQASEAFQASLDQTTAALTEQSRAIIYDQIIQSDRAEQIIALSSKLGLSMEQLVDVAIDPTSAATRELNAKLAENATYLVSLGSTYERYSEQADATRQSTETINGLFNELSGTTEGVATEQEALREKIAAVGSATSETASKASLLAGELTNQEQAAQDAVDALDELSKALSDLNSPTLDARAAERAWYDQLQQLTESLKENGNTLDVTTEAGRKNQEQLDGLASSGGKWAQSILEKSKSVEDFRANLDASRQSLFEQSRQFYETDEAAWAYVNSVLAIPDEATTKIALDKTAAEADVNAFITRFSNLNIPMSLILNAKTTADVQNLQRRAGIPVMQANGGVVDFYAGGGLRESHTAQIVPAGSWRVFGEPETGGEAYIPMSPAKRGQSTAILEDVAARFGLTVTRADQIASHAPAAAPSALGQSGPTTAYLTDAQVERLAGAFEAGASRITRAELTSGAQDATYRGRV